MLFLLSSSSLLLLLLLLLSSYYYYYNHYCYYYYHYYYYYYYYYYHYSVNNIPYQCDINCAGHFTLDALASRPVACFKQCTEQTTTITTCVYPDWPGRSTGWQELHNWILQFIHYFNDFHGCFWSSLVSSEKISRVRTMSLRFVWMAGHTARTCSWVSMLLWHALHVRFLWAFL